MNGSGCAPCAPGSSGGSGTVTPVLSGFAPAPSMAREPHEARFGRNMSSDSLPTTVVMVEDRDDDIMAVHRAGRTLAQQLRQAIADRDLDAYYRLYAAAERLTQLAMRVNAFGYLQPQLGLPTPMALQEQFGTADLSAHRFQGVAATGPVWPAQDATYFPAGQTFAEKDEFAEKRIAGGVTPSDWNEFSPADRITYLLNNAADERVLDQSVLTGVEQGYKGISEAANAAREALSGIPASAGTYAIEAAARTRAAGQIATTTPAAPPATTTTEIPLWGVLLAAGGVGVAVWYYNTQMQRSGAR